jgi:choline dehydrogenase-like flavoprotein
MIIDGRTVSNGATVEGDVCLIGAGAAGITLAAQLKDSATRTILLESGGLSPDPVTQSLYAGENVGIAYQPLDRARSRFFGGSTSCWGGWCRPLDGLDFEERAWMPNSGWPFARSALDSHYARAAEYLRLSPEYDTAVWSERLRPENISLLPIEGDVLQNMMIQLSPPGDFGALYKEELEKSAAVRVILYSNVVKLQSSENAAVIENVTARTLTGSEFRVRARYFVLCSGGIENARLLLLSNDRRPNGLGNDHDVVGRYFMDHPRFKSGRLRLKSENRHRPLYDVTMAMRGQIGRKGKTHRVAAHIAPTARAQRDLRLPNSRSYFEAHYAAKMSKGYLWLRAMRQQWRGRRVFGYSGMRVLGEALEGLPEALSSVPLALWGVLDLYANLPFIEREFQFESVIEPAPNPESRVTLSSQRDRLGLFQTRLDWRLSEQDYAAANSLKALLRDELQRQDIVSLVSPNRPDGEDASETKVMGCWHHMGTTRMHKDRRKGVVDENLKVHGVENLFISGSSVFPTAGSDCPTITLVALSIRLAAHLRQVMVVQPNG